MVIDPNDYLQLEDLLVDRLKTEMTDLRAVMTATDLAGVQGARQVEPAAHVIYIGDQIGEGSQSQGSTGASQVVTQHWMVVLVVKFAGTPTTGKGNRKIAGTDHSVAEIAQWMATTEQEFFNTTSYQRAQSRL
jgi:hypothetical protein